MDSKALSELLQGLIVWLPQGLVTAMDRARSIDKRKLRPSNQKPIKAIAKAMVAGNVPPNHDGPLAIGGSLRGQMGFNEPQLMINSAQNLRKKVSGVGVIKCGRLLNGFADRLGKRCKHRLNGEDMFFLVSDAD